MKQYLKVAFFLPLLSCNSTISEIIEIDLGRFDGTTISLSEIADDITYIPIDNDYPMSIYFQRIEIFDDTIYLTEKDIGMFALDMSGKMVKRYGSKGRGPGEYMYGNKFTIDREGRILYLLDMKNILKYSLDGTYLGKISLDKYAGNFKELRYKDSMLMLFEFIALGEAVYDWIAIDSSGNLIREKLNYIPSFKSTFGPGGGVYEFDKSIGYWNGYNDTVFSVAADMSYGVSFFIAPSELRWPRNDIEPALMPKYIGLHLILETERFIILKYFFKEQTLGFIDKRNKRSYKVSWQPVNHLDNNGGLPNDLDGGVPFQPKHYFEKNGVEYLVGFTQPVDILTRISSGDFSNSAVKCPEKKEALIKLAGKIVETDNSILTIVRLKK
jgi:hypothetical protein